MRLIKKHFIEMILTLFVAIAFSFVNMSDIAKYFENRVYDFKMKTAFSTPEISNDLVLFNIDNKSVEISEKNDNEENYIPSPGKWPWKRDYFKQIFTETVDNFDLKINFFDIIMSEPQTPNIKAEDYEERVGEIYDTLSAVFESGDVDKDMILETVEFYKTLPEDVIHKPDEVFGQYIDSSNKILLPFMLSSEKRIRYNNKLKKNKNPLTSEEKWLKKYSLSNENINNYNGFVYSNADLPVKELREKNLITSGFVNVYQAPGIVTDDPIARTIPLVSVYICSNDEYLFLPHVVLSQACGFYDVKLKDVIVDFGDKITIPINEKKIWKK